MLLPHLVPSIAAQQPEADTSVRSRPEPKIDFLEAYHLPFRIAGLHSVANKRDANGRSNVSVEEQRYYYLPLLAFDKGPDGPRITVTDDGQISIPLICDAPDVRTTFLKGAQGNKLLSSAITAGQILPVPVKLLQVRTADTYLPRIEFTPIRNRPGLEYQERLEVRTDPDTARRFAEDFRAGKATLHVTLVFDGYKLDENYLFVRGTEIAKLLQGNKLFGDGAPKSVTRKQIARVGKEAVQGLGITVGTEYEDPDFSAFVSELIKQVTKGDAIPKLLGPDWQNEIQEFFKAGGGDPNDFKTDIITAIRSHQDSEFRSKFEQEVEEKFKAGGSVSLFGLELGGGGEKESKQKILSEVLNKWGIDYSFDGQRYEPKSVNLHQVQDAEVVGRVDIQYSKVRRLVSEGKMEFDLDPKTRVLQSAAMPPVEDRIALLERELDRTTKLEALANKVQADLDAGLRAMAIEATSVPLEIQCSLHGDGGDLRLTEKGSEDLLSKGKRFGRRVLATWVLPERDLYRFIKRVDEFNILRAEIVDGNQVKIYVKGLPVQTHEAQFLGVRVYVIYTP
jgi:hypothetical protein